MTKEGEAVRGKWRVIGWLAVAELLAMVVWFSASAVVPQLTELWDMDANGQAWLTMSVQIGFVVGAFASAVLTLADRIPARWFFIGSAAVAAITTAVFPILANSIETAVFLRFLTGVVLAGVYPVGMKIMATWTQKDRGLGIGLLVGALTVGSASPHLLRAFGGVGEWQTVMWAAAGLAGLGALIGLLFVQVGPYTSSAAKFNLGDIGLILRDRKVMLANLGYLGHMWELYAMWSWLAIFLGTSYAQGGLDERWASIVTFGAVAIGGVGCVIAGKIADRVGRSSVTSVAMFASASCALLIGRFYGGSPVILALIALVWGFFIVADSAQFSASVSELADKRLVGTALTLQTSMGFLLTLVSIRLVPTFVEWVGWEWAFAFLALGPLVGIWAMLTLSRSKREAELIAGSERTR